MKWGTLELCDFSSYCLNLSASNRTPQLVCLLLPLLPIKAQYCAVLNEVTLYWLHLHPAEMRSQCEPNNLQMTKYNVLCEHSYLT